MKSERSKSIWDVDYGKMEERIEARRERIRKRIDAAKRLTKLMKIQKMMGFKGEEEEEQFVESAAETGDLNINNMDNNGMELVSNIHLAGEYLQVEHRNQVEKKNEIINNILDEEETEMQKKFDEIVKTWPTQGEKMKGAPTQLF